jgi:hypothetical protein
MNSTTYVLNTLVPLLALVGLGVFLRRIGFFSASIIRDLNRLLYWIALPALLFYETTQAQFQSGPTLRVFLTLFAATLISIGLGYLAARLFHVPRGSLGAFVQGGFRGNLGFVGLPVVMLALTSGDGTLTSEIKSVAVLAVGLLVPIYNLLAVIVLLTARPSGANPQGGQRLRRILLAIATNPLVIACGAGLLVALSGWQLPTVVSRTVSTLAQMSTPLALLAIGGSLTFTVLRHNLRLASVASAIKLFITPLAGYLIATLIGLSATELRIVLIFLACPTAAASNVMAEQLGSDEKLAASIIVLSTLFSVFALAGSLVVK